MTSFEIHGATSPEDVDAARTLFIAYAESLGFSLCFQGFDEELRTLPGAYAPPNGRLLLAGEPGRSPIGVVALREIEGDARGRIGEVKRLYVQPAARGTGLGRRLAEALLREARTLGYAALRLDTIETMTAAIALYQSLGFREIPPYYANPLPGVRYFELSLAPLAGQGARTSNS